MEEEEEGSEAARDREGLAELPGDSMRGKRLAGGDMCDERMRTPILGGCHGPLAVFVSCARRRMRGTSASISLRGSRWKTWGRQEVGWWSRERSKAPRGFLWRASVANDSRCPPPPPAAFVDGKLPDAVPIAPVIVEKSNAARVERVRGK